VGYLVVRTGVEALLEPLRTLSWWLLPVVLVPYLAATLLHTLGWRLAFARERPPFARLVSIRLAGEAFNVTTGSVGGEPLKVLLLRPRVPLDGAVAAVVIDKTTIAMGQGAFLLVGLVIARAGFALPPAFVETMTALFVVEILALLALALVQTSEGIGRALQRLARSAWPALGQRLEPFLRIERMVAVFYRHHAGRLGGAIVWHLLGWVAGSLEVYLVLSWLGLDVSPATALVIEAFASAVRFLAFMVPAALGALEAGTMVVFGAFGLSPGLGLSVTLIRRLRQIVWVVIGLLTLAALRHPPDRPGGPR